MIKHKKGGKLAQEIEAIEKYNEQPKPDNTLTALFKWTDFSELKYGVLLMMRAAFNGNLDYALDKCQKYMQLLDRISNAESQHRRQQQEQEQEETFVCEAEWLQQQEQAEKDK